MGAGLSGSLAARLLGLAGHRVVVLDKRPDPREDDGAGARGERAINLAISERARAHLISAGLGEALDRIAVRVPGRVVHAPGGATTFQPYGERRPGRAADRILAPEDPVWSVRRKDLAAALVEAADDVPGVSFRFGSTAVAAHPDGRVTVEGESDHGRLGGPLVVGADGTFSRVRAAVGPFEATRLNLAYQQLAIPAGRDGPLRHDAHHLWPRSGAILSALPAPDGSFVATLFLPRTGARSFDTLAARGGVAALFAREFPDAAPCMPGLREELRDHPVSDIVEIHCPPWRGGRVVLAGDSCHTFAPFLGQGANAAIEDAAVLAAAVQRRGLGSERAFALYARRRRHAVAALARLSRVMTPLVLWLAGPPPAEPLFAIRSPAVEPGAWRS